MIDTLGVLSRLNGAMSRAFRLRKSRRGSIMEWGRRFFPDYLKDPSGKHHLELDTKLRGWSKERDVRASIEGPRGCAKSTLVSFLYPLWSICHATEQYIILLAETYDQAVKYLKAIREELEYNEALAEVYPAVCGAGPEWNNDGILTNNGIRVEGLGAGQKIRGRKKAAARPTLLIIDDPEGDDAAYSVKIRGTIRDWATKGVFKAGAPGTNIFIAGTVIHRECLVAHCGMLPGWRKIRYKSIISWPDRMDLWGEWEKILNSDPMRAEQSAEKARVFYEAHKSEMEAGSEVLWPERESLYTLMFMRASEGHTSFESEKQNNPIDQSKCEWDPMLFEGEDIWFDEWPEDSQCSVMALDPSKGRQDKPGDYQAIISLVVGADGVLYCDADVNRRGLYGMVDQFIDISREFRPDVAVVEDVQFQELLLPEIEARAAKSGLLIPVEGIATGGINKIARIRRLGPYISRRRIRFRRGSPGATMVRMQLMDVPNGDFDDGPDALEMAVRRADQLLVEDQRPETDNPY